MRWIDVLRATWRRLFARSEEEARMDDEMRFHIEMETEKNVREGMEPREARRQALLAFGGVEKHREQMRDGRRIPFLENLIQDVRYATRSLRRTPGFTLTVVLTLAVGIGAATSMYGVMSRLLLLPPPHVAEPGRLVKLFFTDHGEGGEPQTRPGRDYPVFEAIREARSLEAVGGYVSDDRTVGHGADASRVRATMVTRGFWSTLVARPSLGRFFTDDEAAPMGGARVAVLGHGYWRRHYGSDPTVIGESIEVSGRPYEIVGVAPRGFRGVELENVDLWLPIGAWPVSWPEGIDWPEVFSGSWLRIVARLAPGVSPEVARAELAAIMVAHLEVRAERGRSRGQVPTITRVDPSTRPVIGAIGPDMQRMPEARVSVWLVGIAAVLLGVACVNVASLLLLRAMRRRREMAVRVALGMGRARMATQLLAESALLALLGGVVALGVAMAVGAWIHGVLLPQLGSERAGIDRGMLLVAGACVLGTTLLSGLAPILHSRVDSARALKDGAQHGGTARAPLLRFLLATQIALSVVLLAGAGLFLRSLQQIDALDLGLDRDEVLVATFDFPGRGWSQERTAAFWPRALERVRALPGVEHAAVAAGAPLRVTLGVRGLRFPGAAAEIGEREMHTTNQVTPGYFAATGIRLLEGRDFLPSEPDGAPVLIINESLARAGWPERSALGECVPFERGPCATVVGVVEDSRRNGLVEEPYLMYYQTLGPEGTGGDALLVRPAPDASIGAATLRRALLAIEPELPFMQVEPLGAALDDEIRPWRLGASVFTAFGLLAVLLAAVGLYSALAYATAQRTREIGIRLAIGAKAADVVGLVIRDGLRVALAGIVLGLAAALVGGRWIEDLLFEVSPRDWRVLGAVASSLVVVALLASWGPARRASRVDPTVAMRLD